MWREGLDDLAIPLLGIWSKEAQPLKLVRGAHCCQCAQHLEETHHGHLLNSKYLESVILHDGKQLGHRKDCIMTYAEVRLNLEITAFNKQAGPSALCIVCLHLHDLFRTEGLWRWSTG